MDYHTRLRSRQPVGGRSGPERGVAGSNERPSVHRPVGVQFVSMTATATLHTTAGDIRLNLFGDQAPKTVRNFTELALGSREWTHPATR